MNKVDSDKCRHFQGNFALQIHINNLILFKGVFFKRITSFYISQLFISINAFFERVFIPWVC